MKKLRLGVIVLLSAVGVTHATIHVALDGFAPGIAADAVFTIGNLEGTPTFDGGALGNTTVTGTVAGFSGTLEITWVASDKAGPENPFTWTFGAPADFYSFPTGLGIISSGETAGDMQYGPGEAFLLTFNTNNLVLGLGQELVFSLRSQSGKYFDIYQRNGSGSGQWVAAVAGSGDYSPNIQVVPSTVENGMLEFAIDVKSYGLMLDLRIDTSHYFPMDTDPPTPNPATWESAPAAVGSSSISMTAVTGNDASAVEYLFAETTGNPGGTDSDWQSSSFFSDSGLDASTPYSYTVTMRDTAGNTGTVSAAATATTLSSPFPVDWPDADNDGIPDANDPDLDGDHMSDAWELTYFDFLSDSDGNKDSDGDRQSDYYEFLAGSNSSDPESVGERFGLTNPQAIRSSNTVTLVWAAGEDQPLGAAYYINYSTNLITWRTLSSDEYRMVSQEDLGDGIQRITLAVDEMNEMHGFFSISRQSIADPSFLISGISDIDQIRKEVQSKPTITSETEFLSRRAALARWFRLLWRQGLDMSSFTAVSPLIIFSDSYDPGDWDTLAPGFAALEAIHSNPSMIPEVIGAPEAASTNKTDWTMYMNTDGSNTGFSPDQGPSTGRIAWRFPNHHSLTARPVIQGGKIYVASPGADVIGFCLDEVTGEPLWRARQYGFRLYDFRGSYRDPIVSPDRVLIRTSRTGQSFTVHDKDTGELISNPVGSKTHFWVYTLVNTWVRAADAESGAFIAQFNMHSDTANEPVFFGNTVYAASVDGNIHCRSLTNSNFSTEWTHAIPAEPAGAFGVEDEHICIGTTDHRIFALDKETGNESWRWSCPDQEERARQFFSTPLESNGRVYVGAASGKLYCVDAASGNLVWEFETGSWIRSRPLVIGTTVYVADMDGMLYAVEDLGNTYQVVWSTKLNAHGFTADLVGNADRLLVSGKDLILYSVSPDNGKVQWQQGILDGTWIDGEFYAAGWTPGFMTSPTVVDDVMYVGGPDGFVNAVDVDTGEEIWRHEIGGHLMSAAPVVAEGKVFIGQTSGDGLFFALDKDTGSASWVTNAFGKTWVSPAYQDGRLFFGNTDGMMYGADASNGDKLWQYDTALDKDPTDTEHIGIYSVPCIDSTNVYVGSWSGYYYSFNQVTGTLNWKTKTKGDGNGGRPDSAAVMIHKGYVYVQKLGNEIVALNKDTGELTSSWVSPGGYLQNGTVAALDDRIYGSAALGITKLPGNATIYGFDDVENSGISTPAWSYVGGGGLTAPVTTSNKLLFGSSADMFVTCLDPITGAVKWRTFTGGEMLENVPAIYGNKMFVQGKNGWIFAIE